MILIEQYIQLGIHHLNQWRNYDVIEVLEDEFGMKFKIYFQGDYIFTLIPQMREVLSFYLSSEDRKLNTPIDSDLFSKVKASLYSLYINAQPS